MIKIIFHLLNIIFVFLYVYPGSLLGFLIYKDISKQLQLTSDFFISLNHMYAFIILSILGIISYNNNKIKILFLYLFIISIALELCHILIPKRSFEYSDLFGNFSGVFLIFILFNLYQFFKGDK